jgi:hypothetical protein
MKEQQAQFGERGHTMMEADSVYSTLVDLFQTSVLYTPVITYVTLMRNTEHN